MDLAVTSDFPHQTNLEIANRNLNLFSNENSFLLSLKSRLDYRAETHQQDKWAYTALVLPNNTVLVRILIIPYMERLNILHPNTKRHYAAKVHHGYQLTDNTKLIAAQIPLRTNK